MSLNRDITVIYYTSNTEDHCFEDKIIQHLSETIEDLPLISVSHKPMAFGKNICVGVRERCAHNVWRQVQIAAIEAQTEFVCTAESDFLRHREFYEYQPESKEVFYIANPLYVLFAYSKRRSRRFYPKRGAENSMIIGRKYLISIIAELLKGLPYWQNTKDYPTAPVMGPKASLYGLGTRVDFNLSVPIITFKTSNAMHLKTPCSIHHPIAELPYWGSASQLARKYSEKT
jgi:hypothetical protein